jgi:hypothetical protein
MTPNEHRLVLHMFIQQTRMVSTLIEVLKSREVLEDDDLDAYGALQSADESLEDETSRALEIVYRSLAKVFDVPIDLAPEAENL